MQTDRRALLWENSTFIILCYIHYIPAYKKDGCSFEQPEQRYREQQSKPQRCQLSMLHRQSIEETEIGLYVTFEYENDGSITSLDGTWFKLCDAEGTEFKFLPGMGGSINDNGDGSFTETISYQKPSSLDGMTITIKDVWNGVSYGPYQMSVE